MHELGAKSRRRYPVVKIILLSVLVFGTLLSSLYFFKLDKYVLKGPGSVVKFITDSGLKSENGRTNVLLLGIGGKGHEGPDLTDTIILASIDKNAKDVVLISIPRDLWVSDLRAKINHVYAYGQEKDKSGLLSAEKSVSQLLGIPVHYAFRVNFDGFTKAINLVGGLNIDVENSFSDPKYPIEGKEDDLCGLTIENQEIKGTKIQVVKDATGSAIPLTEITDQNDPFICRYETLNFKKGTIEIDGLTALKYVRSRHGTNGEGSDFARSARQQKVILAFREKILSSETLTNPKKIINLFSTFGDSIDTDIKDDDIALFAKIGTKLDTSSIRRVVLDTNEKNGKLEFGLPQNYSGQAVVIPKNNNWTELSEYIQSEIFKH